MENNNRIPVVAILGHVDHGKTTILDKIRNTNVQNKEVGGITQKISAFTILSKDSRKITFIDTPGHEAFDLMRVRGGSIADVVLLIVAADDGVQPQTEESIEIIKSSKAKPIVVINKVDLPDINIEKIKRDISNRGLLLEGLGGNIPVVQVSGKTGLGIDLLLETISLVVDVEGYIDRDILPDSVIGSGVVLETVKDKSKGLVSSMILLQGSMKASNFIGYRSGKEIVIEKIKGLITEENEVIESMTQGYGGRILGLSQVIEPGSVIYVMDKKEEKVLQKYITIKEQQEEIEQMSTDNFASFFGLKQTDTTDVKKLKVIIKSSSEGALEAIKKSIEKLNTEEAKVEIIRSGIGDISLNDVEHAIVTKSIILGFEVSTDNGVEPLALQKRVLVRTYNIIYKLVDEVSDVLTSLAAGDEVEEEIGNAIIKQIFTLTNGSQVIGCRMEKGVVKKGCKVYIVRDDEILVEARIDSLRHNKDTITEAKNGQDFGAILDKNVEAKEGDALYCYKVIK